MTVNSRRSPAPITPTNTDPSAPPMASSYCGVCGSELCHSPIAASSVGMTSIAERAAVDGSSLVAENHHYAVTDELVDKAALRTYHCTDAIAI